MLICFRIKYKNENSVNLLKIRDRLKLIVLKTELLIMKFYFCNKKRYIYFT